MLYGVFDARGRDEIIQERSRVETNGYMHQQAHFDMFLSLSIARIIFVTFVMFVTLAATDRVMVTTVRCGKPLLPWRPSANRLYSFASVHTSHTSHTRLMYDSRATNKHMITWLNAIRCSAGCSSDNVIARKVRTVRSIYIYMHI